jgi:hypothetical protein
MPHTNFRAIPVGLGAAAAAFGSAAIIWAAGAPTAHADDPYADILADVQAELADGQTAFSHAATDFASGTAGEATGLTALFEGLDDDFVGVPDILHVGTVDALSNTPVIGPSVFDFTFATPATFTAAVTEAQNFYTEGNNLATTIAGLPANDFAVTALDNALSTLYQWILPDEILTIGQF